MEKSSVISFGWVSCNNSFMSASIGRVLCCLEAADQSLKLNVQENRTNLGKVFPSPIKHINLFSIEAKTTSSKQRNILAE